MSVYRDRKEVGIPSAPSGPSGLGPLALLRARFGIPPIPTTEPTPAPAAVPPAPAKAEAAPVAAPPARVPPGYRPDAVIVVADENAYYPDDRRFGGVHMWTWVGAETWFYVRDYPISGT